MASVQQDPVARVWGPIKAPGFRVRCQDCGKVDKIWTPTYLGPLRCQVCHSRKLERLP